MKRTLAFLTVMMIFTGLFCACDVTRHESGLEYAEQNGEIVIKSYKDLTTRRKLAVPDWIEGKPVTRIDKFGIANAESLLVIAIGKNLREIDDWGIVNNANLFRFEVDDGNKYFTAAGGVLFTKNMAKLVAYPQRRNDPYSDGYLDTAKYKSIAALPSAKGASNRTYRVPDGVTELAPQSFYRIDTLQKLVLPGTIRHIGPRALFQMYALEEINFPEGLQTIGRDGVSFCSALTKIELPSTLTSLGEYAFFDCRNVKTVTVKAPKNRVELGRLWYPTDNGKEMPDLRIVWLNG